MTAAPTGRAKRARLIVFQGIDGSGKTTNAALLADWLAGSGATEVVSSVGHGFGDARTALDDVAQGLGMRDHVDLLGADSCRAAVAVLTLRDLLALMNGRLGDPGVTIVIDRYTYGHYVLARVQGATNEETLRRVFSVLPEPDLTLFLDVPPALAAERVVARGTAQRAQTLEELERLDATLRSLPEFERFHRIDGASPLESVQAAIRSTVADRFPELDVRGMTLAPATG